MSASSADDRLAQRCAIYAQAVTGRVARNRPSGLDAHVGREDRHCARGSRNAAVMFRVREERAADFVD